MARERQRFWKVMRMWLSGGEPASPYPDDPEELLTRAQQEMRDLHARNRERAVQAITMKNNLQQIVEDAQKRVEILQRKADIALEQGDQDLALKLLSEKQQYEMTLSTTRESLAQATEAAELVKTAIRREEERIRQKTAQAYALRAQWKVLQLHREVVRTARSLHYSGGNGEPGAVLPDQGRALLEQAVRQRDELAAMTEQVRVRVGLLRDKATAARDQGNEELERSLLREMEQNEATLAQMREALSQAIDVTTRAERYLNGEADAAEIARWAAVGDGGKETTAQASAEMRADGVTYAVILGIAILAAALALFLLWWLIRH